MDGQPLLANLNQTCIISIWGCGCAAWGGGRKGRTASAVGTTTGGQDCRWVFQLVFAVSVDGGRTGSISLPLVEAQKKVVVCISVWVTTRGLVNGQGGKPDCKKKLMK